MAFNQQFVQGARKQDIANLLNYTQYLQSNNEVKELLLKKQQELEESKDNYVDTIATIKTNTIVNGRSSPIQLPY